MSESENRDKLLSEIHGTSANHRSLIERSDICGCFYCRRMFAASEITAWTDTDDRGVGQTALCPHCGIDAVIGSGSGHRITPELLADLRRRFF
jgi:hypothetical protein